MGIINEQQTFVPLLTCFFFGPSRALDWQTNNRQLSHKELSPLSLPRSTMYILIFSAQGEYIFFPNPLISIFYIFHSHNLFWCTNKFLNLQCYIWDANCIAHNACLLHFVGDMNLVEIIQECGIHAQLNQASSALKSRTLKSKAWWWEIGSENESFLLNGLC